jgi:hypothetical protein
MMDWKGFGRKRFWYSFKELFRHLAVGTEENHLKSHSRYLVSWPRFNPGPPEYEAGMLKYSTTTFGSFKILQYF